MVGCSDVVEGPNGLSDAEIIEMIQNAKKIEIPLSDLPSQSRDVVQKEYYDYMNMTNWKASGLGYEVELAGMGHRSGARNEVYFGIEGRQLDPNDWGKHPDRDKDLLFGRDGYDWKCFELVFPITFDMPDGSAITVINDNESGWAEVKSWFDANPDVDRKPMMQFPVVIFFGEESITLNENEELRRAYSSCHSERDGRDDRVRRDKDCFSLVYPVTVTMPDGSSLTVINDEEPGWGEVKDWYDDNPGYEEVMPEMQYPVDVVYETEDGDSVATINTSEEMELAKGECRGGWGEDYQRECFYLAFPLTYLMPDGSEIEIQEEDDYMDIRNWYQENEGYEEVKPELQYPVNIVYKMEDGDSTVVINSLEEMLLAKEGCRDQWDENEDWGEHDEDDNECFGLMLPVTYLMPDNTTITVADEEGWYLVRDWYENNSDIEEEPSLVYPVDIIYRTEDGVSTVTINSDDEMESAEDAC